MNFSDMRKVLATIQASDAAAWIRAENRKRIYALFNGDPLISEADAQRMGLRVRVNWGEAATLAQHGRRQYTNAFLSRGNFFKVTIPDAPEDKGAGWASFITRKVNKLLKDSEPYLDLHDEQWASVLIQGYGVKLYEDPENWLPSFVAIEDFRVPTDTCCNLTNLVWCAVRKSYTEGELSRKVFGKNADPGWNQPQIAQILDRYHNYNVQGTVYNWNTNPEKMAELIKQNGGYYASDAVPTIPMWHFIFKADDHKWYLRVVPDQNTLGSPQTTDFLYDSKKPFATKREHFVQIQYGDLNTKAPFMYHSVRSLGFLLMEPCFFSNLTRCRAVQHLHEMMNIWLRSTDPSGRGKARKVELYDRCHIPEGVSIVPQSERHQVDQSFAEWITQDLKGLQREASVSYTQDTESRQGDETATAVMARVSSVNAMMSGLLARAFRKEKFAYVEICRRLCLSNTQNPDARRFQDDCRRAGIPRLFVNAEAWEIDPEIPMGSGNPTMEQAITQQLLGMRQMFGGQAQQEILHEATIAVTGDYRKADRWAPIDQQQGITDAQEHAELAFGTLMQGVPIQGKQGLNPIDQIETITALAAGVVSRIAKTGGVATDGEIAGLATTLQYVGGLVQQLAQDKSQLQRVKAYGEALGNISNEVKGLAQRSQEHKQAMAQNGNGDGGKTQAMLIQAQTKSKIKEAQTAQQMEHKQIAFQEQQHREDQQTVSEIARKNAMAQADAKSRVPGGE
jgi:hypothetical protein